MSRARVRRLPAHLLRRHVADRAEDHAGAGAGRDGGLFAGRGAFVGTRQLREAEVEDLHAPVVGDEQVLGLQVAMDDALVVRGREAVGDLHGVVDGLAHRQRARAEPIAQRLALEQLRDDVRRAVLLADVVDGEDVRMIERGGRLRLLLEAAEAIGVRGEGRGAAP